MRAFEARLARVEDQVRRLLKRREQVGVASAGRISTGGGGVTPQTATYIHNQLLATDVWVIEHNLGRFPSVTVVDSTRREFEGEVKYDNERRLRITFSAAFSGQAYLN